MTEKDLKAEYQRETGKYTPSMFVTLPDVKDYINWLEGKVIQFENENYKLKIEVNLKNNDYELRKGLSNR